MAGELDIGLAGNFQDAVRDMVRLSDRLQSFSALSTSLAGNPMENLSAGILGRAGGFDAGSLGARIHGASLQGLGAAVASEFGIPIRPVEIGEATNRADMLLRALEGLSRTIRDEGMGSAIAKARNLGAEELIPYARVLPDIRDEIREMASESRQAFHQEAMDNAVRFSVSRSLFEQAMENLGAAIGTQILPPATGAAKLGTWFVDQLADQVRVNGIPGLQPFLDLFPTFGGGSDSLDANTQAVNRNTEELRNMSGIWGGGRGARTAIPAAFGPGAGYELSRELRTRAIEFGAYSISK